MNDPTPTPSAVVTPAIAVAQIAVGSHNERDYLFALASDGTIWRLAVQMGEGWKQLPPLPAVPVGRTAPVEVPVP